MADQNTSTPASKRPESTPGGGGTSSIPTFGTNQNIPFVFQPLQDLPQILKEHSWSPPQDFAPERVFSLTAGGNQRNANAVPAQGAAGPIVMGSIRRFLARRQQDLAQRKRRRESGEEHVSNHGAHGASTTTHGTTRQIIVNLLPAGPDLPSILRSYLHICFGFCFRALLLYIAVRLVVVLQQDVTERVSESSLEINQEIAICARHYKDNRCGMDEVPAMIRQCGTWETCMNRNPAVVGRAKVGAGLVAEVLNGFVEPISWKTLTFVVVLLMFFTFSSTLRRRYQKPNIHATANIPQNYQTLIPAPPRPTSDHDEENGHLVRRRRL